MPVETIIRAGLLLSLSVVSTVRADPFTSRYCRPLLESTVEYEDVQPAEGLFWQIDKGDGKVSYLFGVIHLSDPEVTALPEIVERALVESEQFVMEALPDPDQMLLLSNMMFFLDGQLLLDYIDAPLFEKVSDILSSHYQLGPETASIIKPWAVFLTMNYPPERHGVPLDLMLLSRARQNGAAVAGLESLQEQANILARLPLSEQIELLTDTVCHYDIVVESFTRMKSLYLKRDLAGLYNYSRRYNTSDRPVHRKLIKKLVIDRNITMVERMQPMLRKGKAFISIGALHLVGEQGVIALLKERDYKVTRLF